MIDDCVLTAHAADALVVSANIAAAALASIAAHRLVRAFPFSPHPSSQDGWPPDVDALETVFFSGLGVGLLW